MKRELKSDSASALIKRATDILFMHSPVATSLGVMCGFFLEFIATAFKPFWVNSKILDLSQVSIYSYLFSGIFICNVVALLFSLFRRRSLPPEIENQLTVIRLAKKEGELSEYQIRLLYENLADKVLQSVTVDALAKTIPEKKSAKRRKPSSE